MKRYDILSTISVFHKYSSSYLVTSYDVKHNVSTKIASVTSLEKNGQHDRISTDLKSARSNNWEQRLNIWDQLRTMVAHFVCILFTGFVIYTSQPGSSLFSWHPTLMTLAFTFLVVEAILIFSPQSSLLLSRPRKLKVTCHWILMVLSLLLTILGFLAIYFNKESRSKPHFTSWHSICGIATILFGVLQCCSGLNVLYPKVLSRFTTLANAKLGHATSGLCLVILSTFAILTGMFSNWFQKNVTGTSWYACLVCPLLLLLIVMTQIKNAYLLK